jgi:hypothetical protein
MARKRPTKSIDHRAFGTLEFINQQFFTRLEWCGFTVDFTVECSTEYVVQSLDMAANLIDFQDAWSDKLWEFVGPKLAELQESIGRDWSVRTRSRIIKSLKPHWIAVSVEKSCQMYTQFYLYTDDPAFPKDGASDYYLCITAKSDPTFFSSELQGGD